MCITQHGFLNHDHIIFILRSLTVTQLTVLTKLISHGRLWDDNHHPKNDGWHGNEKRSPYTSTVTPRRWMGWF